MNRQPSVSSESVVSGSVNRAGQMTAVMRAMAVVGPKVLRIGVVQAGRVIEERILKQRTTISIGPNEKATFVVQNQNVPPNFKLFERVEDDYCLNFIDGMTGRVALSTGITDIAALRNQAKKVGNAYQVRISEETRGKIVVGDTTFLFQFVVAPPVQPRPQLPLAVKGGLSQNIDWPLTVIASFSFMLHFGIIGAMYSDWVDPVVRHENNTAGLVDLVKSVPQPPEIEKPAQPDKPAESTPKPKETSAVQRPEASAPTATTSRPRVTEGQATRLVQQAERMEIALLASLTGNSAVGRALDRSEVPVTDLSEIAKQTTGATADAPTLGGHTGPMVARKNGLNDIVGSTTTRAVTRAGDGRDVEGPKADAQPERVAASVPISDVDRVVAGLRPKFKSCYQKGLARDPNMAGRVVLATKVAPTGEVGKVDIASNTGLSPEVANCIAGALRDANFAAPGGNGSTIQVPVTFVQQK